MDKNQKVRSETTRVGELHDFVDNTVGFSENQRTEYEMDRESRMVRQKEDAVCFACT
jgi:hypothetical protein